LWLRNATFPSLRCTVEEQIARKIHKSQFLHRSNSKGW
jgi:hypothetical protein